MFIRYNRHPIPIFMGAAFGGKSGVTMQGCATYQMSFDAHGISDLIADAIRVRSEQIMISGVSGASMDAVRVRRVTFTAAGISDVKMVSMVFQAEELIISSLFFRPGDTIVIDLDNQYITHNGQSIMDKYDGEFFNFFAGLNTLKWTDDQIARVVKAMITFQNKYL